MKTIGEQIHSLNDNLNKDFYRVGYSSKEDKYYLFDSRYEYRVHEFQNQNELLRFDIQGIKNLINIYENGPNYQTALTRYRNNLETYVSDFYGYRIELMDEKKLTLISGNRSISLKLEKSKNKTLKELKNFISSNMRKLA